MNFLMRVSFEISIVFVVAVVIITVIIFLNILLHHEVDFERILTLTLKAHSLD